MIGWRRAADSCEDATLGRICKSAPTDGCHKFNGASGWVHVMPIDLLAQSAVLCCPNALRLYKHSILSISFTVIMIGWRRAADSCEDSTLGRICKSAPTTQSAALCCPNALRLKHSILSISFTVIMIGWRRAADSCKDSTLGRICKSAPTTQSAVLCCPNALRPSKHSILSISFKVIMIGWRRVADSCEDSTLGRICKSAPTGGCHKFNGASGWVHVMPIDLLAQSAA